MAIREQLSGITLTRYEGELHSLARHARSSRKRCLSACPRKMDTALGVTSSTTREIMGASAPGAARCFTFHRSSGVVAALERGRVRERCPILLASISKSTTCTSSTCTNGSVRRISLVWRVMHKVFYIPKGENRRFWLPTLGRSSRARGRELILPNRHSHAGPTTGQRPSAEAPGSQGTVPIDNRVRHAWIARSGSGPIR